VIAVTVEHAGIGGAPRSMRPFMVLGFASTHDALEAERVLEAAGLDPVPVPAPPAVSALCGIAMRVEPAALREALEVLSAEGIGPVTTTEVEDV